MTLPFDINRTPRYSLVEAPAPIVPAVGDRVFAQINTETGFAVDALILDIDDEAVIFDDMVGRGRWRYRRDAVTFYPHPLLVSTPARAGHPPQEIRK